MQNTSELKTKKSRVFTSKEIRFIALLIALDYVFFLFNFKSPWGSIVHLGRVIVFASAIIFGAKVSGVSVGIAAFLFDMLLEK